MTGQETVEEILKRLRKRKDALDNFRPEEETAIRQSISSKVLSELSPLTRREKAYICFLISQRILNKDLLEALR